jgi:hypothetical protein
MKNKNLLLIIILIFSFSQTLSAVKGDANEDTIISIIDALTIARYYVGLNPTPFNVSNADVAGCDNTADLIDALTIARYTVGLITRFEDCSLSFLRTEKMNIMNGSSRIVLKGLVLANNVWGNWIWPVSDELQEQGMAPLIQPRVQDPWVLTDSDFNDYRL